MEYFNQEPIESIKKTLEEYKIYNSSDDAMVSIFIEAIDKQLSILQEALSTVQDSIHLSSASGTALEDHFEPFGINRTTASNSSFTMAITFDSDYKVHEVTSDSSGIIIPAESCISIGTESSGILTAQSIEDIYFGPNDTKVYATFILDTTVLDNRIIPANAFNGFQTDVKDAIDNISYEMTEKFEITCTNPENISISIQSETDQELRVKGINKIRSTSDRTKLAVETALGEIPGLVNIEFIKNKIGIGTAAVILTASNQSETESIYAVAQDILNTLADDSIILVTPTYIDVTLVNKMVIQDDATTDQIAAMKIDTITNQMHFINSSIAGKTLQVSGLNQIAENNPIVESSIISCIKLDGIPMNSLEEIVLAWDEQLVTTVINGIAPIYFIQ